LAYGIRPLLVSAATSVVPGPVVCGKRFRNRPIRFGGLSPQSAVPSRSVYYDRKGNPITMEEWCEALRGGEPNADPRRVALDVFPKGRVSTVWLGLDHSFDNSLLPLIFETMVFPSDGFADEDMDRYASEEEARAGHKAMVERWKDRLS
jgi:hypothetical protein